MSKHGINLTEVNKAVVEARREAYEVAKRNGNRCVFSRGTFLATSNGGQCQPCAEADCPTWEGTLKEIDALIDLVIEKYPNVREVYIGGGFDGADSPQAYRDGDYEPWASAWDTTVWVNPHWDGSNSYWPKQKEVA